VTLRIAPARSTGRQFRWASRSLPQAGRRAARPSAARAVGEIGTHLARRESGASASAAWHSPPRWAPTLNFRDTYLIGLLRRRLLWDDQVLLPFGLRRHRTGAVMKVLASQTRAECVSGRSHFATHARLSINAKKRIAVRVMRPLTTIRRTPGHYWCRKTWIIARGAAPLCASSFSRAERARACPVDTPPVQISARK
jgi:hypothetical protein